MVRPQRGQIQRGLRTGSIIVSRAGFLGGHVAHAAGEENVGERHLHDSHKGGEARSHPLAVAGSHACLPIEASRRKLPSIPAPGRVRAHGPGDAAATLHPAAVPMLRLHWGGASASDLGDCLSVKNTNERLFVWDQRRWLALRPIRVWLCAGFEKMLAGRKKCVGREALFTVNLLEGSLQSPLRVERGLADRPGPGSPLAKSDSGGFPY